MGRSSYRSTSPQANEREDILIQKRSQDRPLTTESIYNYLHVAREGRSLQIALMPPSDFRSGPLGGRRLRNAKILFRRFISELAINSEMQSASTSVRAPATNSVLLAIAKLDRRVTSCFNGPVSGRMLRQVLNVTSAEQARWLRDGRLPSCSRQRVGNRRMSFSVPVYDAELVASLERNPSIIAAWRAEDDTLPSSLDDTTETRSD